MEEIGDKAMFSLPETKLGIIPGAGGTQRMTRLVGVFKAKELIYSGRRVDGAEAERIGQLSRTSLVTTALSYST